MNAAAPMPTIDFAALWREYSSKINSFVYRRTNDPHLSEDLTADVFVRAIDVVARGTEIDNPPGFLFRSAHNAVIDHYRARDRQPTVDLEAIADVPHKDTPQELAMVTADRETVQRALSRLTDDQAEVIELRYLDGLSFGEIATIMGKNESAVKALRMRALNTLCVLLGGGERPPREDGRQEKVAAALREHGPMTMRELEIMLHERKSVIDYALNRSGGPFVRVGTRTRGQIVSYVWGLAGVHDQEAA